MKSLSVWSVLKESTSFTLSNWKIFGKLFSIPLVVQSGTTLFINSISLKYSPLSRPNFHKVK
jgi:hypothetical protein